MPVWFMLFNWQDCALKGGSLVSFSYVIAGLDLRGRRAAHPAGEGSICKKFIPDDRDDG